MQAGRDKLSRSHVEGLDKYGSLLIVQLPEGVGPAVWPRRVEGPSHRLQSMPSGRYLRASRREGEKCDCQREERYIFLSINVSMCKP